MLWERQVDVTWTIVYPLGLRAWRVQVEIVAHSMQNTFYRDRIQNTLYRDKFYREHIYRSR